MRSTVGRAWRGIVWATPGQIDAGMASLATFGAGIYAVRALPIEELGAYSLLFAAFLFANQFSTELILIPTQVLAVDLPTENRLGMMRHSIPRGLAVALLSACVVPLGLFPLISEIQVSRLLPLAVSAAGLCAVSPLQDHVRSMFHLSARSWVAASMSVTHLAATGASIVFLSRSLPLWTPFGALALGNVVSLGLAMGIWGRERPSACPRPSTNDLRSIGGWLLVTGLVKTGAGYASRGLLHGFVGLTALGLVEAARVTAQPINVIALGLMSQIGPRLTDAAANRDLVAIKRWRERFVWLLFVAVGPYVAITALPWRFNPLANLTPLAYVMPGLTAAMLVAVVFACLVRPLRAELLGVRLQRTVTAVTVVGSLIELVAMPTGRLLGPFVIPLGGLLSAVTAVVMLARRARRFYLIQPQGGVRTVQST